jgi:hypothetical protein
MTKDKQMPLRISSGLIETLDELRRREKDLPTRAEMIRRLIERASDEPNKNPRSRSAGGSR